MIGAEQQQAIAELAKWYIEQSATLEELKAVGLEIAWLKTAVPLRKSDLGTLAGQYRKQERLLKTQQNSG